MKKNLLLIFGILFLFALEILRVYFIMPFPGSQTGNTIGVAYFIDRHILVLRLIGLLIVIYPLSQVVKQGTWWGKLILSVVTVLYVFVCYQFNFKFLADKMFYQPRVISMVSQDQNKVGPDQLVIGISLNGEAKAYPIQIIGYHHQVRDTVGGIPIMVTYCTVCRTGRIYSPLVNGHPEQFRLVGMDHFNAMFEDASTQSWWQQATGVAVAGPLKGTALTELPSSQMRLSSWLRDYPQSLILQPDPHFKAEYADLAGYDQGTIRGSLERRDNASWEKKSWVVGVIVNHQARAFDWNILCAKRVINDQVGGEPMVLFLEKDTASFHAWQSRVNQDILLFVLDSFTGGLRDSNTHSVWSSDGVCISGKLAGNKLMPVRAYQEFWHSWRNFHPSTSVAR